MKTFKIWTPGGWKEVAQLATFAYYVQGEQFRFVVTKDGGNAPVVTHRGSGLKVADVNAATALGDYVVAGKAALDALTEKVGAARLRSSLAAAEARTK